MFNQIQNGEILEYINGTGSTITSGSLVLAGALNGIALTDIANGDSGSVYLEGVFELPKKAEAMTQGQKLYWDATNNYLTVTATNNTYIGAAWLPAASGAAVVRVVLLNGI